MIFTHIAIKRVPTTNTHCLKTDTVKVTFGEQQQYKHVAYGVLSDGTIGSVTRDNPLKNFARDMQDRT